MLGQHHSVEVAEEVVEIPDPLMIGQPVLLVGLHHRALLQRL